MAERAMGSLVGRNRQLVTSFVAVVSVVVSMVPLGAHAAISAVDASDSTTPGSPWVKRRLATSEFGVDRPGGLLVDPAARVFYVAPSGVGELVGVTFFEEPAGLPIPAAIDDPLNAAYDPVSGDLVTYRDGGLWRAPLHAADEPTVLGRPAVDSPRGVTVDTRNGDVYVLDAAAPLILRSASSGGVSRIPVGHLAMNGLRGLAFNPADGLLYLASPEAGLLWALTTEGALVASYQTASLELGSPQSMVFGPSADPTDDPSETSLYVLDAGSSLSPVIDGLETHESLSLESAASGLADPSIVEISLVAPEALNSSVPTTFASLVATTETSLFNPPSPDPAGLAYLGASRLLISDSEVNEMGIYAGRNLFESTLSGALTSTFDTTVYSDEPTGVAFNPSNGHLFVSDDTGSIAVYEVAPGLDGQLHTPDDVVTTLTASEIGLADAEGIAYDSVGNELYVIDGISEEVYRINPGPNGVFDGTSAGGDDVVTNFDTTVHGVIDPEGIEFNPANGHLYLLSKDSVIAETLPDGTLIRYIDISAAAASQPAGLTIAPASGNPAADSIYVVARGVDNNSDPNENDGKLFELSFSTNIPPTVDAGADQTIDIAASVALDGTVSDDGQPDPPGATTTIWTQLSGPGTASFADAGAVDTTASFSSVGVYTLRLTADDGADTAFDDVAITVTDGTQLLTLEVRVNDNADDSEEVTSSGAIERGSSDLELVDDGATNQVVGIRFASVDIPAGATIFDAYVQFKVDETDSGPVALEVRAQAHDNAPGLTQIQFDLSSRTTTTAFTQWSPPAWSVVGEAGPDQRTPSIAAVIQEVVDRPGWTASNAIVVLITGTGERTAEAHNGDPTGAPLLHVEYTLGTPGNQAPVVDAGVDQSVVLPVVAVLAGSVSDDGLPDPPGLVSSVWSQVSGSGTATFVDASVVDTSVSFSAAGVYVLRLTADDSVLSAFDEVTVTVEPAGPVESYVVAEAESTLLGSVVGGSYVSTHESDNLYEQLSEQRSGGNPSSRVSSLDHSWTFLVPAGDPATFAVEAYHTANGEGDDFTFAYSTDGINFIDMLVVAKTADDDQVQTFVLPAGTAGTVTVRVRDTDRSRGAGSIDSLFVDRMYVVVTSGGALLPTVTVTASDASASESGDQGVFTVTRIGSTAGDLTVFYTVGGTATGGSDYEALLGEVVILDGSDSALVVIEPVNDGEAEGPETVVLTLSADVTYAVGFPAIDTVTILDNDGAAVVANGEQTSSGLVAAGSYLDTRFGDNVYEAIIEERYGGGQRTRLEHIWTFNLVGATSWAFEVEAYHDPADEGFLFEYSVDGVSWQSMLTVTKTADDDTLQTFAIPEPLSGTVYVRVVDTNRSRGDSAISTIYVDHMQFVPG